MSHQIRPPDQFPEFIVGRLERGPSADWLLTEQGRWQVRIDSFVKPKQLKGWSGQWKRRRVSKGIVVVQPWEMERQLIESKRRPGTTSTAPVISSSHPKRLADNASKQLRPAPPRNRRDPMPFTLTAVGRESDRREQVRVIRGLSRSDAVDDWVQLASCWSVARLRSEVEAGLARIGWQRIEGVLSASDAWSVQFWSVVRRHADLERRAAQAQRDRQMKRVVAEDPGRIPYHPRVPESWLEAGWTASDASAWFSQRSGWIPPPELALQWWQTGLRDVSLIERLNEALSPASFRSRYDDRQPGEDISVHAFARRLDEELHPKEPSPPRRISEPEPMTRSRSGEVERSGPFRYWLEQNQWPIEQARLASSLWRSFMATVYDESLAIDGDSAAFVGPAPSQDWLDEVISKADNLRPLMRRVPVWPAIFESPDLTVIASENAGVVAAWVGRGRDGLLLSFDTLTFRAWGPTSHPSFRFALGAAVSWFVDLAIVPVRSTPPGVQDNGLKVVEGSRPTREARRYVPLPSYHDHVEAVWRRGRTSPMAYRISGFRRRLPAGFEPSDWALSNAPAHIRAVMEPDETFVRDHIRGGHEEMERLRVYLSKYSLLADTVGLARRRP